MPVAEDQWSVVKTEPLPKQQASGDPWAVVKTEPAQAPIKATATPSVSEAPAPQTAPAAPTLPTLNAPKRSLSGRAWDWARDLPTGLGGAKGTFGQVFDDAKGSIGEGWAHTQKDIEQPVLPHVVGLLEHLDNKFGPPKQTPEDHKKLLMSQGVPEADAEKMKNMGSVDPLRTAIDAYKSTDPQRIAAVKDRSLSVSNVLRGVGAGGREVADGLSTVENGALLFALSEESLPRAVKMLTNMKFTYDQAKASVEGFKRGYEAYKKGDALTATQEWTSAPVDALFAFLTGKHLKGEAGAVVDETLQKVVTLDKEVEKPQAEGWRVVGSHPDTGLPVLGNPDVLKFAWDPKASSRALKEIREEKKRSAGIAARPQKRQEAAEARGARVQNAKDIAATREDILKQRTEAQDQEQSDAPVRHVDARADSGHITYQGHFFGEDHSFGVTKSGDNHMVYRQTPRGAEWLDQDGNFSAEPESLFVGPNQETADTVARIASLSATADSEAGEEGATEEQIKDADTLSDIKRSLVAGEIDFKEAQKRAGIAERAKLGDQFDAAREGKLNGPFHESSPDEFYSQLESQARESGMSDEEVQELLDGSGTIARQQTEINLHHVSRPGDYVVSKRGVKWTLDSKGMLHPDDGGAPVPLMKRGIYSNQALQLAGSGRVGYGTRTREQRRADNAKRNDIAKSIREQQDKVDQEMRLAVQREGLETAPEAAPRGDIEEKGGRAPKWLEKPPAAPGTETLRKIGKMILKAPADENSVIQTIARVNDQSPEEVMRIALANNPERANTTEAKIARLEVGDQISDKFRPDNPYIVEEDKAGNLWLRSRGSRIALDRLNFSGRVRQLVEAGKITSVSPEFSESAMRRAAFEASHVIRQKQAIESIREQMEGKKAPEPRTQRQAEVQAKVAEQRADDAKSAATTAVIDAMSPSTDNVEQAVNDVDKAQEQVKIAEEGYAQEAEAKAKTIPEDAFPQRAPASIGYRGNAGTIVQNNREFQFHYELLPIKAVQTSHEWNGNTLEVKPGYPKPLQPRTISQRQSDKNAMKAQRGKWDFRQYADKGISGAMGPTIVDQGAWTIGGNTRIAIMLKHLENIDKIADPEEKAAAVLGFKSAMRKLAQDSGIAGYPDDDLNYVVVRMLDKPVETTREAAELGRLFNKKIGEEITKSAKGVSYSKAFDEPLLEDIGRRVEAHEGVIAAMQADPDFFRDIIENRFGITEEEEVDWFKEVGEGEKKQLVLNDDGRDQFVKALLGTVVKDTSVLNRIEGKTPYRALERGLSYILKMKALPDRDITGKILEALQASADTINTDPNLHSSKDKWSATFNPQQAELAGMETETLAEPDRVTEALWRALNGSDAAVPRVFNDRLKSFIGEETSRGGWIFGEHQETSAEAFNRAFGKELREVAHARGDKTEQLTDEEFNAALRNRELSDVERDEATNTESHKEDREAAPEQETGGAEVPPTPKFGPPPQPAPAIAEPPKSASPEKQLAEAKTAQGYVTPNQLLDHTKNDPVTANDWKHVMHAYNLMAEFAWDDERPEGVDRKDALAWVLKDRVSKIEPSEISNKRGSYSDPLIEAGFGDKVMKFAKEGDISTRIHEFGHVIFPFLSRKHMLAIDSIGEKVWDGKGGSLKGAVYTKLSEKFTHALEQFTRDENPTGFGKDSTGIKTLLAKVKEIMREVYLAFRGDPLSEFKNTEASRAVFAKMFHITGFDMPDIWREEVKKARAAEKKIPKPEEAPHPITKLAKEVGAKGVQESIAGHVEDSAGDRVDPTKPTAVFLYESMEDAVANFAEMGTEGSKIPGAELIQGENGRWGIRINTKTKLPGTLNQELPERNGGLRLEELEAKLKSTPPYQMMQRKLLELQIRNLKNEIRSNHGVEERKPESSPELAKAALQEVRDARTNGVREVAHGVSGVPQPPRVGGIPKPPKLGMPNDAAARGGRVGAGSKPAPRVPASLEDVRPVTLEPLPKERGVPRGTIEGEPFDSKAWTEGLKRAGLPENAPPPTVSLDRTTAEKLKFPGQKQSVQLALSALEQGDGVVLGNATGSGKTYLATGLIKEYQNANPNARILYVTKNAKLKAKTRDVAANTFGFNIDVDKPKDVAVTGAYAVSYMGMMQDAIYKQTKWDLVVADESGEARNWFKDDNKQGKLLMEVINNSKKAVYMSATPFHSPSEYGYLDKLGLWPKGQFDKWIQQNFAHENVDGKIVAKLDPGKQAKLRQQLIERGQFVSQAISYDGFSAHFGVVPVTDQMKRGLDRIREGFARARAEFLKMGKKGLAEKSAAFEATYTKAFLERERLPQAIELARKARENGWQVVLFSEHSADDLFRREREEGEEASTYQQLDDAMGGQLSRIIPPFPNVYNKLREAFGAEIGDYSGRGNTQAERDKAVNEFLAGQTPMMYTTYAAGGIGVDMHDADFPELGIKGGDKPRISIFLGPPYSGVLLEQAMGRTWRFGVKSNTISVFLATDSEPDIRLMTQKVGPRMRALRAAVLGEKDSLASAMATYTDEEKVKARQDALAYAEGNEMKVDANSFTVRSKKRDVGVQDWSAIQFPSAETAKNKGMKYGEEVTGGDWSTLFQDKYAMYQPPSPKEAVASAVIDGIANGAATGAGLPEGVSVQNLDPADRDVVVGAASAVATGESQINVDRDREAAARQSMQAQLNMPGDKNKWMLTWPKGSKLGVWKYTGDPEDLKPTGEPSPELPKDIRTWYAGNVYSQEVGIKQIARQAKVGPIGENIVRMNRSYQADRDLHFSQFAMVAADIMGDNKLDHNDPKMMSEIWDVVEGKWSSADPTVNKAANEIAQLMETVNDELAKAGVKVKTPTGEYIHFSELTRDRKYMPHRIDWDAMVEDPSTGEKHKLKDVMGKTFAEEKRAKIIQALAEASGATPNEVLDYLNQHKPGTPVLGHIHRARVMNFPIIKKDWVTLMGYFDQAAEAIGIEKNFGTDRKKLNAEISRIPSTNGRKTINSMFDSMLEPQDWQSASSKMYNMMIGFEALSKMTLSAAKVPYHLVHAPLSLGGRVMPMTKALARAVIHPQQMLENATYVGTLARHLNIVDLFGDKQEKGLAHEVFKKTLFNSFYKWGRAIAGDSARIWMEQYAMHELRKGGTSAENARRLLRDTLLVGDKAIDDAVGTGQWAPEDLAKAQTAFANFTMFSDNSLQMPGLARLEVKPDSTYVGWRRALRLTYALQSFSIKTTSLIREKLYDEVVLHHNLKPLAYFMLAYPIIGEMLRATSAGVRGGIQAGVSGATTGHKKHDAWDKYLNDLQEIHKHPVIGALKRYIDDITFGIAWDRTRRLADPLFDLAEGENKRARTGWQYQLEDEIEQDIGAAWTTMVLKPLELMAQEGMIATGTKGTEEERHKHEEKTLLKFMLDEFPITKEDPQLQDWLKKKKQTSHGPARF